MHILVASPYVPWPLIEGGRAAQYRTFEALRDVCRFTLVVPVYSAQEEAEAGEFAGRFSNITMRAVRCFPPPRVQNSRERLRRVVAKWGRRLFPAPDARPPASAPAGAGPYYPFSPLPAPYVAAVENEMGQGCEIVQAEFAPLLTLGPLLAGRLPSIFIHHQLHHVYAQRWLAANEPAGPFARYMSERIAREEAAYIRCFDSVIVFSEVDRAALAEFSPGLEVTVSPFPSPEDLLPPFASAEAVASQFVFVASESHQPNVEGLCWFMQKVWPLIKGQIPHARLDVIGKWSEASQSGIPHVGDICFRGFVPELGKALQHKIMVVPVWVGSGIRTKILAAWSAACAVVTTSVGVEGLGGIAGRHFLVADEPQAFAERCCTLARDSTQRSLMAAHGLDLVRKDYSLAAVREARRRIYQKSLERSARASQ